MYLPISCDLGVIYVIPGSYETPPPFLCQYLGPLEEVEGELPEQSVQGILDQPGEPGPMSAMMKMADAKILFHHVPDLGDGLVPLYLIRGQLGASGGFSHNAVLDLVHTEKLPVFLSKIALVGKDLLYGILGMTTASDTQREIRAVMERCRGHFRRQDKAITGIYGSVLLQSKVRDLISHCPVRIEIAGKLHRLSRLIQASFRRFSFDFFFLQFIFADGMAGRLYQAGVDGNAFIDG